MPQREQKSNQLRYLKGVGERRAELFEKLGVDSVEALLRFYPRRYLDLSVRIPIEELRAGEPALFEAEIERKRPMVRIRGGRTVHRIEAADETGPISLVWFNNRYTPDALKVGTRYAFYGRIQGTLLEKEVVNPILVKESEQGGLIPQYSQSEGLSSKVIAAAVKSALGMTECFPETLPEELRSRYRLLDRDTAVRTVHFPKNWKEAAAAKRRLIFEELLTLQLGMNLRRAQGLKNNAPVFKNADLAPFLKALPFTPTAAQRRSMEEIAADLKKTAPMARLVQGDVGSGKTAVAAAAVYLAHKNGYQSAVMAPTELLAKQHADTFSELLRPFGVEVALLTSSVRGKARAALLENLENGRIGLIVGTHALISGEVHAKRLGLVVADEQHRFGVNQRAKLAEKGRSPHLLVMSATPIPRTLALMIYGDLDLSVIDEMPPGRRPVKTYFVDRSLRTRYLSFVRRAADAGYQAYIVCPLVESGEHSGDMTSAVEYCEMLQEHDLAGLRIGLIHGRMGGAQKQEIMEQFRSGELQVLVSTTVIEVGVDNPNAAVMLIEDAERFGLSELHQLRGRVGRGRVQSFCVLVSDAKPGTPAHARLKMMTETSSGFEVARYDLAQRGPGDFFGSRQHGLPELYIADLAGDEKTLYEAQEAAREILDEDPSLKSDVFAPLLEEIRDLFSREGGTVLN